MKYNSFIITGHGRSGTKFLSNILDKSTLHKVIHEVDGDSFFVENPIVNENIKNRFSRNNYGEVNSYLRYNGLKIRNLLGIRVLYILRSPIEIAISCSYRRNKKGYSKSDRVRYLKGISESVYKYINFVKDNNIKKEDLVLFKEFTSDCEYIFNLAKKIGVTIEDRKFIISNFSKKLNSSKRKANSLDEVYDYESQQKIISAEKIYKTILEEL